MARNHAVLVFTAAAAVLLLSVVASAATMMAPAPAPTLDCSSYFTNLTDCLPYVVLGSNLTKPDKACCPELAGLLDSNPICLCSLLGVASSFGVDVNRAVKLPSACNITTPSLSLCPVGGVPTASEAPAAGAPSLVPVATTPPSGITTPSIAQVPSPGNSGKGRNGAPPAVIMGLVLAFLVGLLF